MNLPLRFLAAIVAAAFSTADAATFTVSPDGDDANDGSTAAPFRTIARARDAVRALPDAERAKPIEIILHGGLYPQSETLVFGLEDSGRKKAPVIYRAADGETPVITSSVPVTGWRRLRDFPEGTPECARQHLWVADIPEGVDRFHVLFDGNRMLERARGRGFQSPQQKFKTFATRNTALPEDRPLLRRLDFPKGAIRNWPNLEDIEIFFCGVPWTQNISPLESVDENAGVATLRYEGNTPPFTTPKPYNPARVENVIDVLDTPGEWCVNSRAGKIYYWPVRGEPGDRIHAPRLVELVRVEGKIDRNGPTDEPVRHLEFRGLTFTGCDRYSWWDDHKGWGIQHDWDKWDHGNALLRFRGAEDCRVEDCHFTNSGNSALRLDLHARRISVRNNLIERVGHMGILLCGYGPGSKDVNTHNRIENNLIERCGEIIWHGHAIFVWQSGHNTIANNLIRDVPRKAVGLCGVRGAIFQEGPEVDWDEACKTIRWDELGDLKTRYKDVTQQDILPFLHTRNTIVENNHVERSRTKIGDGASLNVSGAGEGNVIRRNLLLQCLGNGLRCDDWQRGTLFTENIILSGGIVHKGHNDIVNNLFLNTNIRFSLYPGQQPDPGSKVQRNLFYFTRTGIAPYVGRQSDTINTPESCDVRDNLYFATEGNEVIEKFLAEKQSAGLDKGSRCADPLFVHPPKPESAPGVPNLTLANDSPALATGFQPIDASAIGLRDDFPKHLLRIVEPSLNGRWVSRDARVTASSINKKFSTDLQQLVTAETEPPVTVVYESQGEETPRVDLDLGEPFPINGLHIVANSKDRQNSMRALTAWSSVDGKTWREIWHADPYHIAMGRQWRVSLDQPVNARFIRIGLRPRSTLQMRASDERIQSIKSPVLRLKQVRVFAKPDTHP